jgi:hypothetical protein
MSDRRAAAGLDRLPWLSDEPVRKSVPAKPARRARRDLTGWAVGLVVAVAGVSFVAGLRSHSDEPTGARTVSAPAPKPVELRAQPTPPQVQIAPQPQIAPAPQPEVRIVHVPEVRIVTAPQTAPSAEPSNSAASNEDATQEIAKLVEQMAAGSASPPATQSTAKAPAALRPWPPRVIAGAYGRLVQIGAYGSVHQAKVGWVAMVRAYPALKHLPAVVATSRNSHGRLFYRFQIGTTSQAHSEVLCQRMEKIRLSCAVVGLPWKSKVER